MAGDPFSTVAEMVADASVSIIGGIMQNKALRANAKIAQENAGLVMDQAGREEGQVRRERDELIGSIIASAGASGVTMDGSPALIAIQAGQDEELRALNVRYRGQVAATGYRNQASALRLQAKQALIGGYLGALGPVFKGFGSQTVAGEVDTRSGPTLAGSRALSAGLSSGTSRRIPGY